MINKTNYLRTLSIFALFLGAFLFFSQFASPVLAQIDTGTEFAEELDLPDTDPRIVIARAIRIALGFLGIIAVSLIIYAGWLYMTSEGQAEKINKAKDIMKNAAIGLLIIVSAFTIVSFILSYWQGSGGGSTTTTPGGGVDYRGGVGALGACSVESVYPEDLAKEVPRNSAIIVTFKEAVKPGDVCSPLDNEKCNGGLAKTDNVKLFKQAERSGCLDRLPGGCTLSDLKVYSTDNRTFVFVPTEYLGSASENMWYGVRLSNGIKKENSSDGIFESCRNDYLEWQFQVSNKLDLTPPQVESVFPVNDTTKDEISGQGVSAARASSTITVNNPNAQVNSSVGRASSTSGVASLTVQGTYNCNEDGDIVVSVATDKGSVSAGGIGGLVSTAVISGDRANIGCGLTVSLGSGYDVGNSWTFRATSTKIADTIRVGNEIYTFGTDIQVGANNSATARNITSVLNNRNDVTATTTGSNDDVVKITSRIAGTSGNQITVSSSNNTRLAVVPMSGGTDQTITYTVKGRKDQPRNVIVQINFNEAVNPLTLSGASDTLQNYIKVASGTEMRAGRFEISNGYRTVEFIPAEECGTNSCGEKIYCLPGDSEIIINLTAASLATCASDNDCVSKSPYNTCSANCSKINGNEIENYPLARQPINGVVDLAFNSLDGDKDGNAEASTTDNFSSKFFTTSLLDTDPPKITGTTPNKASSTENLVESLKLDFDKVLMSSSLKTGATQVLDKQKTAQDGKNAYITHRHLNMWNFTNQPLGYWIAKNNLEKDIPDGVPEYTQVLINHTMLADMSKYRAQAGSGIRDIYQNCYAPSEGPACTGSYTSCCNGATTTDAICPTQR